MPVTAINSYEEFKSIINDSKDVPILIDFWATWCGPCRAISPLLEKFSEEVSGVKCYKVDIDVLSNIGVEASIRAVPTFMVFKSGNKIKELSGADPTALKALVAEAATL